MISYYTLLKLSVEEIQAIHPHKIVVDEFHNVHMAALNYILLRLQDANPYVQVLYASKSIKRKPLDTINTIL